MFAMLSSLSPIECYQLGTVIERNDFINRPNNATAHSADLMGTHIHKKARTNRSVRAVVIAHILV